MRSLSVGIFLIVWLVVVPRNIFAQGDGDLELNLFFGGSWHSTNGFEIGFPQAVTPIQSEFKFNQLFAADSVSTSLRRDTGAKNSRTASSPTRRVSSRKARPPQSWLWVCVFRTIVITDSDLT